MVPEGMNFVVDGGRFELGPSEVGKNATYEKGKRTRSWV